MLKLPLARVQAYLSVIAMKDACERAQGARLALFSRSAFSEDEAKALRGVYESMFPETTGELADEFAKSELAKQQEEATLRLLEQAGRFPVRRGKTSPPNA